MFKTVVVFIVLDYDFYILKRNTFTKNLEYDNK